MRREFSSGLSGFILGLAVVVGVVFGGLIVFFFLKWYITQIDLKDLVVDMVLR